MDNSWLEDDVIPGKVKAKKTLSSSIIYIWNLYIPESLRLNTLDNAWDLLHIHVVEKKELEGGAWKVIPSI